MVAANIPMQFFNSEVSMSNNLINFNKKKLTLEQRDVDFLRNELQKILGSEQQVSRYLNVPFYATEIQRHAFEEALEAASHTAIQWLIDALGDYSQEDSEVVANSYHRLISWFRSEKKDGERYHYSIIDGDIAQYAFAYNGTEVVFMGYYTQDSYIVTMVMQNMVASGVLLLGYANEEE